MKRLMPLTLAMSFALAACQPAAEPQPATPAATPETPAAAATPPPAEPIADTHGGAAAPTPQASGEADDHSAVNASIASVLGDPAVYEKAILAFQQAVAQKDAATVATMVDYPFKASIDGKATTIADAPAFIAKYGQIVTPEMADVITQQRYSELFVNQKGVMFGQGEAWLNGICLDDKCEKVDVKVVALQKTK